MRRLTLALLSSAAMFAAGAATAADMPVKSPRMAVVAPAFSWTGFYIGANAGYGWGDTTGTLAEPIPGNFSIDGWLAGIQGGFNYQFAGSPIVIGLEADYQWADISGTVGGIFGFAAASGKVERFGTVRGRVGFAWDRFMIYGTGGWAFGAEVTGSAAAFGFGLTQSQTLNGWTAGAGIEWAFAPQWSAKLEYLHIDLDTKAYFTGAPIFCLPAACQAGADIDLVRVGVNWRFGGLFGMN